MKEIIKSFHFADKLQKILVVTYPKKKEPRTIYWFYMKSYKTAAGQIAILHIRTAVPAVAELYRELWFLLSFSEHLCYTAYLFQLLWAGILFVSYYLTTSVAIEMFQKAERSELGQMKWNHCV